MTAGLDTSSRALRAHHSTMKRTYRRRSDEQMIEDLEAKVREVQQRVESRQRKDSPVLKEIPKLKRKLAGFAQLCMDHNRKDLSNTVLAFLTTIEVQAKQVPEEERPRLIQDEH